ncbi:MAG: S8 family serine peptidase [bacterium]|nr:S8 family serine peptidase [bacterium]
MVHTIVGSFDLTAGALALPLELTTTERSIGDELRYFIVQMDPASIRAGLRADLVRELTEAGGTVVRPLPVSATIVRLNAAALDAVERGAGVTAVEPYHPALKLDPSIGRTPLLDPFKALSETYELEVLLHRGESTDSVVDAIVALEGKILRDYGDTLIVTLHRDRLPELARLEPVAQVFESLPVSPTGEETTVAMQTGTWNGGNMPYHDRGIDGGGEGDANCVACPGTAQVMMLLDTGIQLDAADLSDTATEPGVAGTDVDNAAPDDVHRKVLLHETTHQFGGLGDLLGCDAPTQGGFTHGHVVAATAAGWATEDLPDFYCDSPPCQGFVHRDPDGAGTETWKADGVAKKARLVVYDGQSTPPAVSCFDPLLDTVTPGDLYSPPFGGSLGESHFEGARIVNFSWGSPANVYNVNSFDIDNFLFDERDAMVFVSAGNSGDDADDDGVPDEGSIHSPATTKNGLAIGASGTVNPLAGVGDVESRASFSSIGPAPGNRIAPQLMAPGTDFGEENLGIDGEFVCRSHDNDQEAPVLCDLSSGFSGTSVASAAAAGAGALVRDYFAQGFYPDGTSSNPANADDLEPNISGALLKAILVSSANFMNGPVSFSDDDLTIDYRFNNEQGYGAIQLDNVLKLDSHAASPTGLIVVDGGISGSPLDLIGMDGVIDTVTGETDSGTFVVTDPSQELRVSLAWIEDSDANLLTDLDLVLTSPLGKAYFGNYFTDDDDRDGTIDTFTEDCPDFDGQIGSTTPDSSEWSLPVCLRQNATVSPHDTENPTEAIFLTPDLDGDNDDPIVPDPDPFDDSQIETGTWTVQVTAAGGGFDPAQRYALVVSGGVGFQSSALLDKTAYVCNDSATITIHEFAEVVDLPGGLTTNEISGRVTVEVYEGETLVDEETGIQFSQPDPAVLTFVSDEMLLAATGRVFGNSRLDVRTGDTIRAIYRDETDDVPDPNKLRVSSGSVDCRARIEVDSIAFAQFGRDTNFRVDGGCETSDRGLREFGFPDRYMDAGEQLQLLFGLSSRETIDLEQVEIALRCVEVDDAAADADCSPGDATRPGCTDSLREGHTPCPGYMTILNSPVIVGRLPAGAAVSASFAIQMASSIAGEPQVELVFEVTAPVAGKSAEAVGVSRQTLDVDEDSVLYSTDFPTGGVEFHDINENESIEDPTTDIDDVDRDYRFETRVYGDLTAGGTKNLQLGAPWNFDLDDGNFKVGLAAPTDEATIFDTIAQWGEDKNFNGLNDGRCNPPFQDVACTHTIDCLLAGAQTCHSIEDRDPVNGALDLNWSTLGGCGWQSKETGQSTGGVWHTGRIGPTSAGACFVQGASFGQCQGFETVSGSTGQRVWFELLETPVIQKVGGDAATVEILNWAWNQQIDLPDTNVLWTWEFDTDTDRLEPVDTRADRTTLNFGTGPYGAVTDEGDPDSTNGFSLFAPLTSGFSTNGTLGGNRVGDTGCFFASPGTVPRPELAGLARPLDNDLADSYCADDVNVLCPNGVPDCTAAGLTGPCVQDNALIDEYVQANGPIRNMDIRAFDGPDMRFSNLEDRFGETGDTFVAALGMVNLEKVSAVNPDPQTGFGVAVDDMVIEWREYQLVTDSTDCAIYGQCAAVAIEQNNLYEGSASLTITVLDASHDGDTDCDLNGTGDGTDNCDADPEREIVVEAVADDDPSPERILLDETSVGSGVYRGAIPLSTSHQGPGVLFARAAGPDNPTITVTYRDNDDGTGSQCRNHVDPAARGDVQASTMLIVEKGDLVVTGTRLTDNGDNDGWADTNETVDARINVSNRSGGPLTGCTAWLVTNDPKIDCILDTFLSIGDLDPDEERLTAEAFRFHVAESADRANAGFDDLGPFVAEFDVMLQCDQFGAGTTPQGFTLNLDLDAAGGSGPTDYFEGFAVPSGLGSFTTMNLDFAFHSGDPFVNSEGYRCQYSDPDWVGSNSYGIISDCYVGATPAQADAYFWQLHRTTDIDGGKAFEGIQSLYMGIFGPTADEHTTPMANLEAVGSAFPINLGWDGVVPQLSFMHQVSFMDERTISNVTPGEAADRGVVQIQLADENGSAVGDWIKLEPHKNLYDQQGTDDYPNCLFDPIDDGNTEDDFFAPEDPARRLGPSSTCYPAFSFVNLGETFAPFSAANVGNAEGPGLPGSLGTGTWVESRFDLGPYRGRRIRLRFLNTAIKAGTVESWEQLFGTNPDPADDGWWIDNVLITDVLTGHATLSVDSKDNSGLAACGQVCDAVTADLQLDPAPSVAPGHPVELDASASAFGSCHNGVLQHRFSSNLGGLLRDWADDPVLLQAPTVDDIYRVDVRCSSDPGCADFATVDLIVGCTDDDGDGFDTCTECDDSRASVFPGAPELCDGLVNDCDAAGWPTLPDNDRDLVENFCDLCPDRSDPLQRDQDGDGIGDLCDNCPDDSNAGQTNSDTDGHGDACDNCDLIDNEDQVDSDFDSLGDACDPDSDNDGIPDAAFGAPCTGGATTDCNDNCPTTQNASQADGDFDGVGDACDTCDVVNDPSQADTDLDGLGDFCDDCTDSDGDGLGDPGFPLNTCPQDSCPFDPFDDDDGDGVCADADNCPDDPNPGQGDFDDDGVGDVCDNCPDDSNPGQGDFDGDGDGNACDDDIDGDGNDNSQEQDQDNDNVPEDDGDGMSDPCPDRVREQCDDNCPFDKNRLQRDLDGDGVGSACDFDDGEVGGVSGSGASGGSPFAGTSGDAKRLDWEPEEGAVAYNIYRGLVTELPESYGSCYRSGLTGTQSGIVEDPPLGQTYFYLITAEIPEVQEFTGTDGKGQPRPPVQPCPE